MNETLLKDSPTHHNLILFTDAFPYGTAETFLETEILYLSEVFNQIIIVPYTRTWKKNSREEPRRSIPSNAICKPPLIPNVYNRTHRFFSGIFNFSPITFCITEFLKKRVFLKKSWFSDWLNASLRTRAILTNSVFRQITQSNVTLYFYWGKNAAYSLLFLKKVPGKKVIRFHGGDLYEEQRAKGYIPFREPILKSLTHAVFISEHGEKYLHRRFPKINFVSQVFRLGVPDTELSSPSQDNILRIVSCSALIPVKRVNLIISALMRIDFPIEWTHFGDGPERMELLAILKKMPKNVKVTLSQNIPNRQLRQYYVDNPVDIYLLVSESEGVPVSIMEALSAGIPVMATDVGGVPEIVDSSVGRLLSRNISAAGISKEICTFYLLPLRTHKILRQNARNRWQEKCRADILYRRFADFLSHSD
ncbi:MAG: glycosyltransferase [Candidatus Marinimicrobia bacterium]|nr:glycosyltransferase [Candidatus Neomarinimicrobiota bacterium]